MTKMGVQLLRCLSSFYAIRLLVHGEYAIIAIADRVAGYLVALNSLGLRVIQVSKRVITHLLKDVKYIKTHQIKQSTTELIELYVVLTERMTTEEQHLIQRKFDEI